MAIELHPGFVAYHTESFWRLREIGGEAIGVNFDPSHLFWQGMDPLVCVRELGDAIFHVHTKDTWLDRQNIRRQRRARHQAVHRRTGALLDLPHRRLRPRRGILAALISELRLAGYDGALSIEHEDSLMSVNEGFTKAVQFLKQVVIREQPGAAWWI